MEKDRISYYTSRITSESMTGIIVTMYEIFFEYIEEANCEGKVDPESIRQASKVLNHLKNALNFEYDISANLFSLYDFCERQLAKAMYTNNSENITPAKKVMKELYESFVEVNKQSNSDVAMQNSQHVSAGLTYGKKDLNEVVNTDGSNRGFFA